MRVLAKEGGELNLKRIPIMLFILFLLSCGAGCRPAPVEPPGARPSGEHPVLPPQLEQTGQEEPTLRVYVAEEGAVGDASKKLPSGCREMDPNWPTEALAAQAIIAHLYAAENSGEWRSSCPRRSRLHGY